MRMITTLLLIMLGLYIGNCSWRERNDLMTQGEQSDEDGLIIGGDATSCGMTRHPTKDGWWRPWEGEDSFIPTDEAPEHFFYVDGVKRSAHYWRTP